MHIDKLAVIGSTPIGQSIFCPMPLEGIKMIGNYYRGTGPSVETDSVTVCGFGL